MPWIELLVPALVLLLATPNVALAYVYARSSRQPWSRALLGFLAAAAGVSLLTAVGIFLRASGLVETKALYFAVWNLSFLVLAVAAYFAIATALLAVGASFGGRRRAAFWAGTVAAYAVGLVAAVRGKDDLYFPYIGGTYAATSFYLFAMLGLALFIVVRLRGRLGHENDATLRRFLRAFLPLGSIFFIDELLRVTAWTALPWRPLLPLAPLALYAFTAVEFIFRVRRGNVGSLVGTGIGDGPPEALAQAIARGCAASPLTLREREVLVELLGGRSNAAISAKLGISPNTVKNHIYSIFQKTGAGSRKELFLFAARAAKEEGRPQASSG